MGTIRTASWFPVLSILLMAVFLQAQAAGCCKLGARFLTHASVAAAPAASAPAASAPGSGEHACCRRAPAGTPDAVPCHSVKNPADSGLDGAHADMNGCCLQGADANASGMASTHTLAGLELQAVFVRVVLAILPGSDPVFLPAGVPDPGPPASRANLPLLI